jgi:hypothetical protein
VGNTGTVVVVVVVVEDVATGAEVVVVAISGGAVVTALPGLSALVIASPELNSSDAKPASV